MVGRGGRVAHRGAHGDGVARGVSAAVEQRRTVRPGSAEHAGTGITWLKLNTSRPHRESAGLVAQANGVEVHVASRGADSVSSSQGVARAPQRPAVRGAEVGDTGPAHARRGHIWAVRGGGAAEQADPRPLDRIVSAAEGAITVGGAGARSKFLKVVSRRDDAAVREGASAARGRT